MFKKTTLPYLTCGPYENSEFTLAAVVNRELLSLFAEGKGDEGFFSFHVPPPRFTRAKYPHAMFLVHDNGRLANDEAATKVYSKFVSYAQHKSCEPIPMTLDYERRTLLFKQGHLMLAVTDSTNKHPWNLMDALVLLYADTLADAEQLFREVLR